MADMIVIDNLLSLLIKGLSLSLNLEKSSKFII